MFKRNGSAASFNTCFAGNEAFTSTNGDGYKQGVILGRHYRAHRVIWAMETGSWPEDQIDHENGVRDYNLISNLRPASNQENMKNSSIRSNNTSGHMGVSWHNKRGKWQSAIRVSGRSIYLGLFSDINDAIEARSAANRKYNFHAGHGKASSSRAALAKHKEK